MILFILRAGSIWAKTRENLSSGVANNTGADQPAHRRGLISAFGIRFMESIISKLATSEISMVQLVSVYVETGLSLALWETPKTDFLASRPICALGFVRDANIPLKL